MNERPYALLSVHDKTGLGPLADLLVRCGYGLLSSSGTARFLRDRGLEVTEVEDLTGLPSILGGRVKTLHPVVAGGILARRGNPSDDADRLAHHIPRIDLVVCNLYPFEETARKGADLDELIEQIDIGGVTLLRAAAKNYRHVGLLLDPGDYDEALRDLETAGELSLPLRQRTALKAFARTAAYDALIQEALSGVLGCPEPEEEAPLRVLPLRRAQSLRYGENPHQRASLWLPPLGEPPFEVLSGKELSYNNLLDLDTVLRGAALYQDSCACVIVKHTTPCGIASGSDPEEAFRRALACDPVSAFGGILSFTRPLDGKTARSVADHFFEVLCAPEVEEEALELLRSRRPSLRVVRPRALRPFRERLTSTWCGLLVQDDALPPLPTPDCGTWLGMPRPDLWEDLVFAWKAAALAKSNGVALVRGQATRGIGCGFTNRVDAVRHALAQAGDEARGTVLASDAFFPFPDSVELAAESGVVAVMHPGGSVRDQDVARAALERGLSLFVGGGRTFRH